MGSSSQATEDLQITASHLHRRLRSQLTTVFLASLSICIILFVILALFSWSYASRLSYLTPEVVINQDLTFVGPNRVDILNITDDGGIWLNVQGQIGMDAGSAIGVESDPKDSLFRYLWKGVGRWSIQQLDRVSVNLSTITILSENNPQIILVTVDVPPVEVPLTLDPPRDTSWLTHISMPIHFQLMANTSQLFQFLKDSWLHGSLAISANVGQANIRGGSLDMDTWRSIFHGTLTNIQTSIHMKCRLLCLFHYPYSYSYTFLKSR